MNRIVLLFGIILVSSVITIIPDLFIPVAIKNKGYIVVPALLISFLIASRYLFGIRLQSKLSSTGLFYSLITTIFIVELFLTIFGQTEKEMATTVAFLFTIVLTVLYSQLLLDDRWREKFLKIYVLVSFCISAFVLLNLLLLVANLTEIQDGNLPSWFSHKFSMKSENLDVPVYSFHNYSTIIMTFSTKMALGINSNPYGVFCGLSYESSLGLLFASPAYFLSINYFKKKPLKVIAFIVFIVHVFLGLSLANIAALSAVVLVWLFYSRKFNILLMIGVVIVAIWLSLGETLQLFLEYKLTSRSSDDTSGMLAQLFNTDNILGNGVFSYQSSSMEVGLLTTLPIICIYFLLLYWILKLLLNGSKWHAFAILYIVLHSLKFPFVMVQLPLFIMLNSIIFIDGTRTKRVDGNTQFSHHSERNQG